VETRTVGDWALVGNRWKSCTMSMPLCPSAHAKAGMPSRSTRYLIGPGAVAVNAFSSSVIAATTRGIDPSSAGLICDKARFLVFANPGSPAQCACTGRCVHYT
jgi:hypothetical protein